MATALTDCAMELMAALNEGARVGDGHRFGLEDEWRIMQGIIGGVALSGYCDDVTNELPQL